MNTKKMFEKFKDIEWSQKEKIILDHIFSELDKLLLSCERERNNEKIEALKEAHEKIQAVVTVNAIKDFANE